MDRIYNFLLNVGNTIRDGANFVITTTIVTLKRSRDENESQPPSSNPLADPQSHPLLLSRPPAPSPTTDEERPFKRRRLSSTTAPLASFAPPTLPAPPTPSAPPSTPFALRRSSSGLPDALQAPTPPDLAFTSRSRYNSAFAARPPLYPSARKHYISRLSGKTVYPRRSIGPPRLPLRSFMRSDAAVSKSPYSSSLLPPPSHLRGPHVGESRAGTGAHHIKRPSFLPPRPPLIKKRHSNSPSTRQRPNFFRSPTYQPQTAFQFSILRKPNALSPQVQPPAPRSPHPDIQAESSDSTDPERVLNENRMRQKATVTGECESKRQFEDIDFQIRQQDRSLKEQRSRRQSLQQTVISRLSQPRRAKSFNSSEKPPIQGPQYRVNYYEDVENDAFDWDEAHDHEAKCERHDQITVIGDHNRASDGPHQVFTSAFAPLTPIALRRLRHVFINKRYRYQQLNRIRGMVINAEDIYKLKPHCWLNDEIINSYFQLLVDRSERMVLARNRKLPNGLSNGSKLEGADVTAGGNRDLSSSDGFGNEVPQITYINSFFYAKLVSIKDRRAGSYSYDYSRIRRWTRKDNVFAYDIMLIPINVQNVHWSLGVINFKEKTVSHLDSMGGSDMLSVCDNLLRWVRDEAQDKGVKDFDPEAWRTAEVKVPQQNNSDDCGVFTCKFGDWVSRGWKQFTFTSEHMEYFRSRIAHELLMGRAS